MMQMVLQLMGSSCSRGPSKRTLRTQLGDIELSKECRLWMDAELVLSEEHPRQVAWLVAGDIVSVHQARGDVLTVNSLEHGLGKIGAWYIERWPAPTTASQFGEAAIGARTLVAHATV